MSTAAPPPPLACQGDPERWFDPRQRRDALAGCLVCPARARCAREALAWRASWGMWAGVWIDGRHRDAAPYLAAIAADATVHPQRRPPPEPRVPAPPAPLRRPQRPISARSASTAVLARSSGHCEVFAPGCRYSFDRVVSRCPTAPSGQIPSPAQILAACEACAEIVACLQPPWATRCGYLVPAGCDAASVPLCWRGSRWVLLGHDGWLTETTADARSA